MNEPVFIKRIVVHELFGDMDIDWTINNSVCVLVGENGAGKTTILKLIRDVMTGTDFVSRHLYDGVSIETNEDTYNLRDPHRTIDDVNNAQQFLSQLRTKNTKAINSQIKELSHLVENMVKHMSQMREWAVKLDDENRSLDEYDLMSKMDKIVVRSLQKEPRMKVTAISTVDLLANLSREFKDNTGIKINYFNEQIKKLYKAWSNKAGKDDRKKLESAFNYFFNDISKKVVFSRSGIKFYTKRGQALDIEDLSSGERQIADILIRVAQAKLLKHDLILMDEPEISLHLSWQKKLLSEIRKVNNYSQIIVVTHSPALILNGWRDSYIDIREISVKNG